MTIFLFFHVGEKSYRLQGIQLLRRQAQATLFEAILFFEIVRDDRQGDETWLRAAFRLVGPRTTNFPVVIGAGSHPFPFRTRKLSLPPPMVLRA